MKHTVLNTLALIAVCLVMALPATAQGPGNCYHGRQIDRNGNYGDAPAGTCPMVSSGEARTITGTVYQACAQGQGLQVDTGEAIFTIFGIGPIRYWRNAGIDRPTVGEEVTINAVEVTFSDENSKLIAEDITIGRQTIDLRDDAGFPLWRGARNGGRWQQQETQ